MDSESQVFKALADKNRRVLLDLLLDNEKSVQDLSAGLTISQPAVSQHLQVLKEAGLVNHQKQGRRNIYSVQAKPLQSAAAWLSKYDVFWDEKIDGLRNLLMKKKN